MPVFHGLPGDIDSPVEIVMVTYPLHDDERGPRDPNAVPDPMYLELKDEIEGMSLVATSWIDVVGNHTYMRQLREDIEELQVNMTMFMTSLQDPRPTTPLDDWGNPRTTKEEYWEHLKDEFETLSNMVDTMRSAPKRVRRTPSGDDADAEPTPLMMPMRSLLRLGMSTSIVVPTSGSSSQGPPRAPAQPPIAVEDSSLEYEDSDAHHHAQPRQ